MSKTMLCVCVLLLVVALAPLLSQTSAGSISGSVQDSSGSGVPAAAVKLVHIATGAERDIRTNELGDFVFASVMPGEYKIVVAMSGFKSMERAGVFLTAAERLSVGNLVLEVGGLTEVVSVQAQGTMVQTVSGERSADLNSAQVDQLLVKGRNVTSLIALMPGVVDTAVNQPDTPTNGSSSNYNVLGNRNYNNNMSIDGVTINQTGGAPNTFLPIATDSVSEVKVLTSNYQPEYGKLVGSNIQILTKSGTRSFHGGFSYFKRHEEFNANNFFNNQNGLSAPRYRYNTWAYTLGGPLYVPGKFNRNRDKLFFLWSHEYWPQKTASGLATLTVPTPLERTGDFSQSLDVNGALIPIKDPLTGQPMPGNVVPANRVDKNGQALLNIFPAANFLNRSISKGAYNFVNQNLNSNTTHLMTAKLDYTMSVRDSFAFTGVQYLSTNNSPNQGLLTASFPLLAHSNSHAKPLIGSFRQQHIFSPSMVNEFTFGIAQAHNTTGIPDADLPLIQRSHYGFNAGQLNPAGNPLNLIPSLSFGGRTGAAGITFDGRFPVDNARDVIDLGDSVSKNIGQHSLKAGIFLEYLRQTDGLWANGFNGTFDFGRNVNNPLESNDPYSNAIFGVFNTYSEATNRPHLTIYSRSIEWYVQDNWRVTRRLTLDYGVRFSSFQPWWLKGDQAATFVPGQFDRSKQVSLIAPALVNGQRVGKNPVTGAIYPAAVIAAIAPGTGNPANGMVVAANDPSYPRGLIADPGILPAPRFGFAYDPFGTGKTAIRGGWGMFFDRPLGYMESAGNAFPVVQTPTVEYGSMSTFLAAQGFNTPATSIAYERNMKNAMIMNMSFSVQRHIGFGTVVDVGYVGSLGRHLPWSRDLQDVPFGARFLPQNADPTNTRVPLPDVFLRPRQGYASIPYYEDDATSNYHSLQVSGTRRFAKNLEFGASWTWSKALDYTDGAWGAVATIVPVRLWNYGLAGFDRTHALKANFIYSLPKMQNAARPVRVVVNDWQVSGITTFQSGAPVAVGYSLATALDTTGTPSISSRIIILSNPILQSGDRSFGRNFRTDVFAAPPVGSIGNAAKTNLRGPGVNDWDIALFKSFPIRERLRFQFRAEAYNAFNHTQFSAWNTTARFDAKGSQINAQFGQDTTARNPRIMQFALRLQF